MERALLDTTALSDIFRGRDPSVIAKSDAYLSVFGSFTFSVITIVEMIDGLRRQGAQLRIDLFLEKISAEGHHVISVDFEIARIAGFIYGDLHRLGQPIGKADPLIAATALPLQIPLVSINTKHFERIQHAGYSLQLTDWRA